MTEATATTAPPPKVSFWEDVIDIFISPASVFRRRNNTSAWPPMLFVAIVIGLIFLATFNTLEPIFAAEFHRALAKQAANPQLNAATADKVLSVSESVTRYTLAVIMLVTMFILGSVAWIVAKMLGSSLSYGNALMIAGWSYMPRILGSVAGAVQGLLMDPANLNSQLSISLSPARFMDVETTNPLLYQAMGRFDIITIWVTILLGVGLYSTGKVSKSTATVFAILMFVIGALPALRQGYVLM